TTCIEKYATYGGTYLNIDCIPSKELFHNFYLYHIARDGELKKRSIELIRAENTNGGICVNVEEAKGGT
ncbi:unnamed protein product, partial [Rotaria sp. Silwood2]